VDPDQEPEWEERVIRRSENGEFTTRQFNLQTGEWDRFVKVYVADNPPATRVKPETVGLPAVPTEWELLEDVKQWPKGLEMWDLVHREMGDQGVIGIVLMSTGTLYGEDAVYDYHDDPEPFREKIRSEMERVTRRLEQVAAMERKPDFFYCGASGTLIWQAPETFRELTLPLLQHATALAADLGIPTHVHSCGPEAQLVQMAAEETKLTIIDPLEIPPMGNCVLRDLKQRFGDKIVLKGNLHTTNVMLRGSADDVRKASRQAIDDAADGGGFILSTGDQCGRDTPDENIFAMVETARTYGKY
jgi:uroporphyrinogen decarboxylase